MGSGAPIDRQAIQTRRLGLGAATVVVLILLIVGIQSCQSSALTSSLKDYDTGVSSLIQQSDGTGSALFNELSSGAGSAGAQQLRTQITNTLASARRQLASARALSVPDPMITAQRNFVQALTMRRDGIFAVARNIEQAYGSSTPKDALANLAAGMARFYSSDVIYKLYAVPEIAAALHGDGIVVGPPNGVTIAGGQFLPSLDWLQPALIARLLGAKLPAAKGKPAAGTHGHSLNSVSVSGTTLQPGSTNAITASPAPTFTLNLTNSGQNTETNVVCKVSVNGTSVSGRTVIPQTTSAQTTTCDVKLSSTPATGQYTVTATVQPVPGEKSTVNNTLAFPVTFQ